MNKWNERLVIAFIFLGLATVASPGDACAQTRHSNAPGAASQAPPGAPVPVAPPATVPPAQVPALKANVKSTSGEEFFITTSVDAAKHQLVLKRPTEVTLLIQTNDQTAITGESGEQMKIGDLRTGDTVFVTFKPGTNPPLALRIRKAPMTVAELHRRYLNY